MARQLNHSRSKAEVKGGPCSELPRCSKSPYPAPAVPYLTATPYPDCIGIDKKGTNTDHPRERPCTAHLSDHRLTLLSSATVELLQTSTGHRNFPFGDTFLYSLQQGCGNRRGRLAFHPPPALTFTRLSCGQHVIWGDPWSVIRDP